MRKNKGASGNSAGLRAKLGEDKWRVAALALVIAIAAAAIGFTIAKERAIPDAPDLTAEQKQAEETVKKYEEAVRKKDVKGAWSVLSEGLKKGSKLSVFEKAVKDFPPAFQKYQILTKNTDRLVNTTFAKDYSRLLSGDAMERSWVVYTRYPKVDTSSVDSEKVFVIIPEKGSFKIYDIR